MSKRALGRLAIDRGNKACKAWPPRRLFTEREKRAVAKLFDKAIASGQAFGYNGPEEEAYCREFARFLGGGYADAVNSGTSAVYVALRALEIEPFTEVIVPPCTDPGGVMPVPLMNCIPVPADSAPNSYNAGPDQIAARINKRTSAIIVAHIAGIPADMDPIMKIARSKGVPVVEDCAQAHGARYKGRYVGTIGDVGAFSTMSGKHHATGGQGGEVFVKDEELYWKARRCSDRGKPFGLPEAKSNVLASQNLNLNDLSACIGRVQLKRLPQIIKRRRKFALAVAEGCKSLRTVCVEVGPRNTENVFWFMLFRLELDRISVDKETFVKALAAEGLPVSPSYFNLFTESEWYKNKAVFGTSGYPWACPEYKGNPNRSYPCPNMYAADANHFRMRVHENLTQREVRQTLAALKKVEAAYAK